MGRNIRKPQLMYVCIYITVTRKDSKSKTKIKLRMKRKGRCSLLPVDVVIEVSGEELREVFS